jgi:predicted AlkP superfamily pyrophosphatase or phosphodiesterase
VRRYVRSFAVVLILIYAWAAWAQTSPRQQPKLVLLVVIDQSRYDYLTRFRDQYTGGFDKLLTSGAVFEHANLDHYPTVTAIGHATTLQLLFQ